MNSSYFHIFSSPTLPYYSVSQDIATPHTLLAFAFYTRKRGSEQELDRHFIFPPLFHSFVNVMKSRAPQINPCGTPVVSSLWWEKLITYSFNRLHIQVSTVHLISILIFLRTFGEWSCQVPFRNPRRPYQLYLPYQRACLFLQRNLIHLWGVNSLHKIINNLVQCIISAYISSISAILWMTNTSL